MLHLSTLNHYPDHSAKFVKFYQFPSFLALFFFNFNFLKYLSFLYCVGFFGFFGFCVCVCVHAHVCVCVFRSITWIFPEIQLKYFFVVVVDITHSGRLGKKIRAFFMYLCYFLSHCYITRNNRKITILSFWSNFRLERDKLSLLFQKYS